MAGFIEQCHVASKNWKDTQEAYNRCVERDGAGESWWQHPGSIAGIAALSMLVGVMVGVSAK